MKHRHQIDPSFDDPPSRRRSKRSVITMAIGMNVAVLGIVLFVVHRQSANAGPPVPHRELHGTVTAVTGNPPVARNAACDVTIDPHSSMQHNCVVRVTCGVRKLYGATSKTGYSHCRLGTAPDGRPAITALASGDTNASGDPALDLHTAIHELKISDRRPSVPWTVTIKLAP